MVRIACSPLSEAVPIQSVTSQELRTVSYHQSESMTTKGPKAVAQTWKNRQPSNDTMKASMEAEKDKLARLAEIFARLFPHRPRRECQYCCEKKTMKVFAMATTVPHGCRVHLRHVCKACLRTSISAQLDSKPLLDVGCPSCSTPWDSEDLRILLGHEDKKRFRQLDLLAKDQTLVPSDLPEAVTLDQMLVRGELQDLSRACSH